jgi:hypothetical protein
MLAPPHLTVKSLKAQSSEANLEQSVASAIWRADADLAPPDRPTRGTGPPNANHESIHC